MIDCLSGLGGQCDLEYWYLETRVIGLQSLLLPVHLLVCRHQLFHIVQLHQPTIFIVDMWRHPALLMHCTFVVVWDRAVSSRNGAVVMVWLDVRMSANWIFPCLGNMNSRNVGMLYLAVWRMFAVSRSLESWTLALRRMRIHGNWIAMAVLRRDLGACLTWNLI